MKCPNCGGEIENNAKFCTFCGSQITVEMQKEREQLNKSGCPKCGSTNVTFNREKQGELKGKNGTVVVRSTIGLCKDCGYTWSTTNTTQPQKKNKTWLWVLGWIFVFPVPLTILMLRKKDMKPALKYGIIAAAWIVYLIIGLSGNSNDNTATTGNNTETIVSENETINDDVTTNIVESQTDSEVVEQTETNYADDEIVNRFISEFQEIAGYKMTDISKGNIRTKYFAYANNCYLEMINATDAGAEAFCISYSFGSLSEEEIYSVFTDCLKTLGATDEEIEKTIADFTTNNDGDYMIEGYETNSSITCTYCPTKELSNGTSIGHIEIASSTFGK